MSNRYNYSGRYDRKAPDYYYGDDGVYDPTGMRWHQRPMQRHLDERAAGMPSTVSPEDFLNDFDHDEYERLWAKRHPVKYNFGSYDALVANGTPPDLLPFPRFMAAMILFLSFTVMVGMAFS